QADAARSRRQDVRVQRLEGDPTGQEGRRSHRGDATDARGLQVARAAGTGPTRQADEEDAHAEAIAAGSAPVVVRGPGAVPRRLPEAPDDHGGLGSTPGSRPGTPARAGACPGGASTTTPYRGPGACARAAACPCPGTRARACERVHGERGARGRALRLR